MQWWTLLFWYLALGAVVGMGFLFWLTRTLRDMPEAWDDLSRQSQRLLEDTEHSAAMRATLLGILAVTWPWWLWQVAQAEWNSIFAPRDQD